MKQIGRIALACVLALVLGGLFLMTQGHSPFESYGVIFSKAFASFDQVLRRMTPLMLTALAVAIPQKTGMLNLGGEGQIIIGSLAAALVGAYLGLPAGLHPIVCILAAAIAGGAAAWIAAVLRTKFHATEAVTTIMLNSVISYTVTYLTMYPLCASSTLPQTKTILESAEIWQPVSGHQWSIGLFIAIILCIIVKFVMDRTPFGLELKSAGLSPLTAKFQGVNIKRMALLSMVLGGALAGVGGSLEILGGKHAYLNEYFLNYGWDGVAVSYMAGGNPIGIIFASLVMAIIRVGATALDRRTGISIYFTVALQGIVIVLMVCPHLIQLMSKKFARVFHHRKKDSEEVA